jgi:hypothetical protein
VGGGEGVCDERFGFGERQISGGVVGLAGASVGRAGDGDAAAIEDFDCRVFVGEGDEGSPAGVDANSKGGAWHGHGDDNAEAQRTRSGAEKGRRS